MKKTEQILNPSHSIFLVILLLALAIIACTSKPVHEDREISLAQTEASIKLTQTAFERHATQTATLPLSTVEPTITAPPEETSVPSETPSTAHAPDILFEGVRFNFDRAIASGIIPSTLPEQIMDEDYPDPSMTYPTHTQFKFEDYQVSQHFHTPIIRVYPVDAFIAVDDSVRYSIASIRSAVNDCPTGGLNNALPFLPRWNATPLLSAKVACFDFQNGSGLRYLTLWGQGPSPVDNQNLFYTYQGITHDGRFYISAILPITHPNLPEDSRANVTDWYEASEKWADDYPATIIMLDEQPHLSFSPNIEHLDEMMASIRIEQ